MATQPPQRAVDNGHDLEWDPPAAMTAALRWTCRACGASAIDPLGNEYGDAIHDTCTKTTGA